MTSKLRYVGDVYLYAKELPQSGGAYHIRRLAITDQLPVRQKRDRIGLKAWSGLCVDMRQVRPAIVSWRTALSCRG